MEHSSHDDSTLDRKEYRRRSILRWKNKTSTFRNHDILDTRNRKSWPATSCSSLLGESSNNSLLRFDQPNKLTNTDSSKLNIDNATNHECCFDPMVNDTDFLMKKEYRRQCILRWKDKKKARKIRQHSKIRIFNKLFPSTNSSQPGDSSKQSLSLLGEEVG